MTISTDNRAWISEKEAAARLSCSPETLRAHRRKRSGPEFGRIGAKVVYEPAVLDAWVRAGGAAGKVQK